MCETFELCDILECQGHFDCTVPSLACILTKQHGVCSEKHLLKTPGDAITRTLISKCPQMPWPLRACAFGASSRATYYSLSACYLKTFLTALAI